MNDMSQVIVPKSDQINADDLIAGPRTFQIEGVEIRAGTEQPVNIRLVGEDRAWRPCKSMSRVLVAAWGPDANVYRGRSITLYRDPKVKWGGMEVGGIRVSHMSHIDREMLLQLTATKGKRAPHIVKPLADAPKSPAQAGRQSPRQWADTHLEAIDTATNDKELDATIQAGAKAMAKLQADHPEIHAELSHAYSVRRSALSAEGRPDTDMGEGFNGFAGDVDA